MISSDLIYLITCCATHRALDAVVAMQVYPLMLLECPSIAVVEVFVRKNIDGAECDHNPIIVEPVISMWDEADDRCYADPKAYRASFVEWGLPLSIWDGGNMILSTNSACACQTPALLHQRHPRRMNVSNTRFPLQPVVLGSRPLRFVSNPMVSCLVNQVDTNSSEWMLKEPTWTDEQKCHFYSLIGGTVEGLMKAPFCTEETRIELDNLIADIYPDYLRFATWTPLNGGRAIEGKVRLFSLDGGSLDFLWRSADGWQETKVHKADPGHWHDPSGKLPNGWLMVRA